MDRKKIRDENQKWVRDQQDATERSDAEFSHGLCPDCFSKASAELVKLNAARYTCGGLERASNRTSRGDDCALDPATCRGLA